MLAKGTATDYEEAAEEKMKLLFSLIGLVLVLEGLPYIAFPELMRQWLKKISSLDPLSLRITGIISVAIGLLICFVARKSGLFH